MNLKTVAAIIVASLVAGVVLGSMGIAGAGSGADKLPGAMAPAPAALVNECGSCSASETAPAGGCPGAAASACDKTSCP